MGAHHSSATSSAATATSTHTDKDVGINSAVSAPAPLLPFGVVLQGLSGSGVSSVQRAASLPAGRVLRVDERFLTSPPIYGLRWDSPNRPTGFFGWGPSADHSAWEYGGRSGNSPIWRWAAHQAKAIVFVVDSTDRVRMARTDDSPPLQPDSFVDNYRSHSKKKKDKIFARLRADMTAKETLHTLLQQYALKHRPVLVLATKQDQPDAMPPGEIAQVLGLSSLVGVDWRLSGCNALTGEGIPEAMHWLTHVVQAPTDFDHEERAMREKERAAARHKNLLDDVTAVGDELSSHETSTQEPTDESAVPTADGDGGSEGDNEAEGVAVSASSPLPNTPTPSETNPDPPAAVVAPEGKPEGQQGEKAATPTPSETDRDLPVEPPAKAIIYVDQSPAVEALGPIGLHPFDSLSSTCVVLPAPQPPKSEPVELELKKRWFARDKLVPKPSPLEPFWSYQKYQHLVV